MSGNGQKGEKKKPPRNNVRLALICLAIVTGMVGMAYAAVPLYYIFCSVTGYGGTTRVAS
ncbi:MAG TPA: cytochrome c oxidase assembly protein, partial [Devosia sp.]|nr:cytochrome c oxidase assembly protein [Devosia sp.]